MTRYAAEVRPGLDLVLPGELLLHHAQERRDRSRRARQTCGTFPTSGNERLGDGIAKGRAAADNLSILAHRLHNGDWSLMVFDDVNLEMLKDGSSERVLRAFTDLPHETDGVSGGSSSTGGGDRP